MTHNVRTGTLENEIKETDFESIVSSLRGKDHVRELISVIISRQIEQQMNVSLGSMHGARHNVLG